MGEPKRYGLIIRGKKAVNNPLKKLAAFGDDSSDDEDSAHKEVNLSLIQEAQKKKQMKQTQIEIQKALKEDPTVYEYDAVYDKMEEKKKAANFKDPEKDRKPKYMEGLLKSAAARKREYERTVERQVQKEREKEQGEFDDKEAFVTEAFRRKMQEQAEEEERLRRQEAIDSSNDVTKQEDLSLFYRNLLNRNVSLGGSFTADDSTKINKDSDDNDSKPKAAKGGQETRDSNRKETREEDREDDQRRSRHHNQSREDRRHRTKSPPLRSRHHEPAFRKRRDTESDDEQKTRSSDSSDNERRRQRGDRKDTEHRRHSSHSERRQSKHEDHRSDRNRSYDDFEESNRKREHGINQSSGKNEKSKKTEALDTEVIQERKTVKEKSSEETISKFAKRSTEETVMSAKERYLARKRARDDGKSTTRNDDSDD
ncbi:nuclear speckle splicing regulatory protein 1-like [Montipora foliosa]|uniref:nuclear speckle splicing regulatory protein 1-like n=1 Tax=Montipora foliosa TaxID=591990 RepID=UPI0035F1DFBD